jgi:hypothetical protein
MKRFVLLSVVATCLACGHDNPFNPGGGGVNLPKWTSPSLVPSSVTMSVGSVQTFTVNGGNPYGNIATEVQPTSSFTTEPIVSLDGSGVKVFRVTMLRRPNVASTQLVVESYGVSGEYGKAVATITVR